MIYLDNAATAIPLHCAVDAARRAMEEDFANPSSLHLPGRRAQEVLEDARRSVSEYLGCDSGRLIFTSCATEGINAAIACSLEKNRKAAKHIVTTEIEHPATLQTLHYAKQQGWQVTYVPPLADGSVLAADILGAVRDDTALVAVQAVNSETGARTRWQDVARVIADKDTMLLVDMVQGMWREKPESLAGVDFAVISGHKIGGIKGAGAMYIANMRKYLPFIRGGGQEMGMRSGTEAMPAIAAFGAACKYRLQHGAGDVRTLAQLRDKTVQLLMYSSVPCKINTAAGASPHIVNISPQKGRSEVYIRALEEEGIYVSGGSACSRGKRSHVLAAMKIDMRAVESSLRISFVPENVETQAEAFVKALERAYNLF